MQLVLIQKHQRSGNSSPLHTNHYGPDSQIKWVLNIFRAPRLALGNSDMRKLTVRWTHSKLSTVGLSGVTMAWTHYFKGTQSIFIIKSCTLAVFPVGRKSIVRDFSNDLQNFICMFLCLFGGWMGRIHSFH